MAFTLEKLSYDIPEVKVIPRRDLNEIYADIDELGYDKKEYLPQGTDKFSHGITYLYMMWSRREKQKRLAIELENREMRRDLMKELLSQYVHNQIIQLPNEEFDEFIDYCAVTDLQMQRMSQYQFIVFVQSKWERYMNQIDWD